MKVIVNVYNEIKAILESSGVEIKHIGWWMDSVERSITGGGFQFSDKAVFIEFQGVSDIRDGSLGNHKIYNFPIRIHVVTSCINQDFASQLLYGQQIHYVLSHSTAVFPDDEGGFTDLDFRGFQQGQGSKDKYDMQYTYTTILEDATTSREKYQQSTTLTHILQKEIDNG